MRRISANCYWCHFRDFDTPTHVSQDSCVTTPRTKAAHLFTVPTYCMLSNLDYLVISRQLYQFPCNVGRYSNGT